MHDLLFTMQGDSYPFANQVRVSSAGAVYEMRLIRNGLVVSGDRCTGATSASMLSAFLVQLVGGEP